MFAVGTRVWVLNYGEGWITKVNKKGTYAIRYAAGPTFSSVAAHSILDQPAEVEERRRAEQAEERQRVEEQRQAEQDEARKQQKNAAAVEKEKEEAKSVVCCLLSVVCCLLSVVCL